MNNEILVGKLHFKIDRGKHFVKRMHVEYI